MLGDLDPSRPNARIVSTRITTPATIVGARSGCMPGISTRSARGTEASRESRRWIDRQGEHVAVDSLGVVGLEPHLDRGQRGRRAGDGDPGRRPAPGLRPPPPRSGPRTSAASASSSVAVGGSVAMWRSVWRTTPACSEAWKAISSPGADDQLGRAAADVDDQRRLGRRLLGGRADVGEARLLARRRAPAPRARSARAARRRRRRRWRRRARRWSRSRTTSPAASLS